MPIQIRETYVNATKGYRFGDSEKYESDAETLGELFRSCQKEFGRCEGSMFVDRTIGGTQQVGWVFAKLMRYEDAKGYGQKDYYKREVWVTVYGADFKNNYQPSLYVSAEKEPENV